MIFSYQYNRRVFWPGFFFFFLVKPRQVLIAVTLRCFSQFPTEFRQAPVLSVHLLECFSTLILQSSRYCTTITLPTPSPCPMCFYWCDKVSSQVLVAKDTTNKRATTSNATRCRKDEIFTTGFVFFFSSTCSHFFVWELVRARAQ